MIYVLSDIHGCYAEMVKKLALVDLKNDNRLIFLGDYIDYGKESGKVLSKIYEIQQEYGEDKVIVLKGNHEMMFLEWIDDFNKTLTQKETDLVYDSWLKTDSEHHYNTFRTLVDKDNYDEFLSIEKSTSFGMLNTIAVRLILNKNKDLISWMRKMKSYYETDKQIFVHAGVDEEAGEYWKWGSEDNTFCGKFPASKGKFIKTIIAGHVGTSALAHNSHFHDVYYDGYSHYYIDGSVYKRGGKLILLGYDEKEDKYYQIEEDRMPIPRNGAI